MRPRNGFRAFVAASILVLGTTAAAASLVGDGPREPVGARAAAFRMTGRVAGLYPGRVKVMRIRLRNPHPFALRLRKLRVIASDPAPGCRAGTLRFGRVRRGLVLPARRTTKIRVRVSMRPSAPDACIGVRYPLRFSGSGVRA